MFSAPPPMAISASPSRMLCAADTMACRPEPHRRFTLKAGVPWAQPPSSAATRERYMSRGSVLTTWPNTTWPTSLPLTLARASDSRTTSAPSAVGGVSFRLPPKVPMAVRTALTTKTSRVMGALQGRRVEYPGMVPADPSEHLSREHLQAAAVGGGPGDQHLAHRQVFAGEC